MKLSEYMKRLNEAFDEGRITAEAYDAAVTNADIFCDEDDYDELYSGQPVYGLPNTYAEIEYEDLDTAEAYEGCRFDDINYLRYTER